MSLVGFHRGLISAAIAFCLGYGAWELLREAGSGAFGMVFVGLGLGLAYYLSRLDRFLGREPQGGEGPTG